MPSGLPGDGSSLSNLNDCLTQHYCMHACDNDNVSRTIAGSLRASCFKTSF